MKDDSEDRADVEKILGGNVGAFEGIVRRWQRPLINLAYRFCNDRGRSEDMAQEAFLRAYRGLAGWRQESAFSTWLFTLATNSYSSELRRIPAPTVALDDVTEAFHPHTKDNNLVDADRERAVRSAVQSLPSRYRETLILFYFHDKDISSAATSLGIPEGTVKARLFRGRELLRRKLNAARIP